ncbi:acyl-coenzyme A diphosphatase Fitm isoform X2 [Oratosquilla oratoria]
MLITRERIVGGGKEEVKNGIGICERMADEASVELEMTNNNIRDSKEPNVLSKMLRGVNHYLLLDLKVRLGCYVFVSIIFSMVGNSAPIPHLDFLTTKNSILNQVFVKQGWGWTISLVLFFNLSCVLLQPNIKKTLFNLMIRVVVLTAFWFLWCMVFFPLLERRTGKCVYRGIIVQMAKRACLKEEDHVYHAFDISGHSFILIYCTLIIHDEIRKISYIWKVAGQCQDTVIARSRIEGVEDEQNPKADVEKWYWRLIPLIILLFLFLGFLTFLWDFMYVVTTVYYHSMMEKLVGSFLGVANWYVLCRHVLPT